LHFIDRDNTYAFFRYNDTDVVFVYVNNSDSERIVPWTRYSEISAELKEGRDVVTGEQVAMDGLRVAPHTARVIEFSR
jgi:vacuolar-type H+-ATPase subunit E/Vma4